MDKKRYKKFIYSIAKIQIEIEKFIKEIIKDSHNEVDNISLKLGVDGPFYKVGICNSKTKVIVIKHYDLKEFMELCANKKIEMELNLRIREMLVKSENGKSEVICI